MAFTQAELDIINMALRRIGTEPTTLALINATPPGSKSAGIAAQFYKPARLVVLRSYFWRSATRRASLESIAWEAGHAYLPGDLLLVGSTWYAAQTSGTSGLTAPTWPSSGTVVDGTVTWAVSDATNMTGQYHYRLPANCVQPQKLASGADYDVWGDELWTDDAPVDGKNPVLVYTADVPVERLPDPVRYCIALRLAMMMQKPIAAEQALIQIVAQEYSAELYAAIYADARGSSREEPDKQLWTEV